MPAHGFIDARNLKAGMAVSRWAPADSPVQMVGLRDADAAKGHLLVKAVAITDKGLAPWRAYNLTVANDHTYFVGETRAWVHNAGPGNCFDDAEDFYKFASRGGHHAWPKYLGGDYKQWLVNLSQKDHVEYHQQLDKALKAAGLPDYFNWGKIDSGKISTYLAANPDAFKNVSNAIYDTTRSFDAARGTNIMGALVKSIFN